ncbi:MAG TPA: AAA domain-containing protein [Actinocatenispora sp.]
MARRRALVVGVEDYLSLTDLPAAAVDARNVEQALRTYGDFDVRRLDSPTRVQFMRELTDMFGDKNLMSDDMLLLYFAGHGLDSDDNDQFYLATTDTDPDYPGATAVDARSIKDLLTETYAQAKVVLLDCCFAGLMGEGLRSRGDGRIRIKAPLDRRGTFVFTATDRTSPAYEDPRAGGQSALFTKAVVEALSGAARDSDADGWISAQDVADHVQKSKEVTSRQKPLVFAQSVTGPIPLARTSTASPDAEPLPAATVSRRRPEPPDDPRAPLDHAAWRKLLNYYVDCLKREAGLSDWFRPEDTSRAKLWTADSECVFTGDAGPVTLSEEFSRFCADHHDAEHFYGYPLVLMKKGRGVEFAPLLITPLAVVDGVAEAGLVELNASVLEHRGMEAGDIAQLADHFAKNFRPGDPDRLATQLTALAGAIDLPLAEELDPTRLAATLRTTPVVEGIHNVGVVWRNDGSRSAGRNLIDDLGTRAVKEIDKFGSTALAALAGDLDDRAGRPVPLISPGPLNESQEAVIEAAMTRRLTVATGPPGTGKTALVTALCATAEAAGQSVLIASTNHRAVDGVCAKLDDIAPGMVVRTGPRDVRETEPARLTALLVSAQRPPVDTELVRSRLRTNEKRIGALRTAIDRRQEVETDLYAIQRHLDKIVPDQAAQALAILKADDRSLDRALTLARRSLRRWPAGILARWRLRARFGARPSAGAARLAELFETEQARRECLAALTPQRDDEATWEELKQRLASRVRDSKDCSMALTAQRIRAGEANVRTRIARLNQRESGASWKAFPQLLRTLPGWAVNGHSSTAIVPKPALFDLVIIDEAAQCATPHVLSLLMRAKRALIIGDPHQLQPVVSLSRSEDDDLRRANGLGANWMQTRHLRFTSESIYTACAAASGEELLLDEHYRCDPAIVAVPNRVVYQGRLTVLTERAGLALPAAPPNDPAVEIVNVVGRVEHQRSGSCRNPAEADRVITRTAELIAEHGDLTIGIVTPYKAQQRLIESGLQVRGIGDRVVVGTIHTFQGGECDVIVLSPVGAAGIQPRSAGWVRSETNLWNVAITRAKSRLVAVCDRRWWAGGGGLLAQFLDGADTDPDGATADQELTDRLQEAIENAGLPVTARNTSVAGHPCQLLLEDGTSRVAVIVDDAVAPDGKRHRQSLALLDLMDASGHIAVRVPAWRVLGEVDRVAEELAELLPARPDARLY